MTKKRILAALLAVMMSASLCGCGDLAAVTELLEKAAEVSETVSSEEITTEEEKAVTEAVTEAEETAADSDSSVQPERTGETPASEDELAEVKAVAEKYFKATEEKDYEALLDVYDIELLYYLQNGELGTREQYMEFMEESLAESVSENTVPVDTTFGDLVCANSEAEQYNEFFRTMDEISGETALADTFKVDGVYNIPMRTKGTLDASEQTDESGLDLDVSISGDIDFSMDIPILRVNGEWKVDPAIGMLMMFYQMFTSLDDSGAEASFSLES